MAMHSLMNSTLFPLYFLLRWRNWARKFARKKANIALLLEHSDAVHPEERSLIGNIVGIGERNIESVMIPRADIDAFEVSTPPEQVFERVLHSLHSRYPVFEKTLDNVLGFFHVKDLLAFAGPAKKEEEPFSLHQIMRPVMSVAPTMGVLDLLIIMRQDRCHLALIVDEYGGIDGMVSIEDLVEEITGEIRDEYDSGTGEYQLNRDASGACATDARIPIEDFEDAFGMKLSSAEQRESFDTLGGLICELAGRVPLSGELIKDPDSGIEYEILGADPRRIRRVRVFPPSAAEQAASSPSPARMAETL